MRYRCISTVACGCRRLGAAYVGLMFVCVRAIQTSKIYAISDNKSNQ